MSKADQIFVENMKDILSNLTDVLKDSQQEQDIALAFIRDKVTELPEVVKGYSDTLVQKLNEQNEAFKQTSDLSISKMDSALEKLGNLKDSQDSQNEILKEKFDLSISKVDGALEKLDKLIAACSKIQKSCDNLMNSVTDVKNDISSSNKSLLKNIKINRLFIIIGIIILAILHFV